MASNRAARAFVASALGVLGEMGGAPRRAAVSFAPPLGDVNRCSAPVTLSVAVRGRAGRHRSGKAIVTLTAFGSGRTRDADRLRFVCVPKS